MTSYGSISTDSTGPSLQLGGSNNDNNVSIKDKQSNGKDKEKVPVTWNTICSLITSVLSLNNNNNVNNSQHSSKPSKSSTPPKAFFSSRKSNTAPASTTNNSVTVVPLPEQQYVVPPVVAPNSPTISSIPNVVGSAKKKTLILDLDETLVHSTVKPVSLYHMTVDVLLEGVNCTFFVIKRPHVDAFLKQVSEWYDCTIFTASMRQYADPLLDQLDPSRTFFKGRLFRESCLYKDGSFIKDLSLIGQDLATTIIIDNSPVAYSHNRDNALPIDNWLGDNPKDESLLNLLPFLDALRFTQDVRSILSLRVS